MRGWMGLGLALTLASAVYAQPAPPQGPGGPPGGRPHARLFISPSGEPFRDHDGLDAWLAGADADHDGAVSLVEFRADALRVFKSLDANADGRLDGFEIQDYEHQVVPEITEFTFGGPGDGGGRRGFGGKRRGRGGPEGKGPDGKGLGGDQIRSGSQGAARFSLLNEPEPLMAADADLDGRVTLAEWTQATERRFRTLDKAGTGKLTHDSLLPPDSKAKR